MIVPQKSSARHVIRTIRDMAVRFRASGCLFSIIASIVLTIALNLMLRGCS